MKNVSMVLIIVECYDKDSIVNHTLTHYIMTLRDVLNGKKIDIDGDIKRSPLLDDFKILWKREELEIVYRNVIIRII